jgi:hypothetical protein
MKPRRFGSPGLFFFRESTVHHALLAELALQRVREAAREIRVVHHRVHAVDALRRLARRAAGQ